MCSAPHVWWRNAQTLRRAFCTVCLRLSLSVNHLLVGMFKEMSPSLLLPIYQLGPARRLKSNREQSFLPSPLLCEVLNYAFNLTFNLNLTHGFSLRLNTLVKAEVKQLVIPEVYYNTSSDRLLVIPKNEKFNLWASCCL